MANKIILPHGCSMSTPSVNPKNWKSGASSLLNEPWRIQYYFYPNDGKAKLIVVKGMNGVKTLADRRFVTKGLIEDEIETNKRGYNPIDKKFVQVHDHDSELHPYLDFITAFRIAVSKIQCSVVHRKQLEWCVERINKGVVKLRLLIVYFF